MTAYFVIGDVHGKYQMLLDLLQKWNKKDFLVFLGDVIDRGEDSKAALDIVRHLVEAGKAICLAGNHEYLFLNWLDHPETAYRLYQKNGGDTTIRSLLGYAADTPIDAILDAQRVLEKESELVSLIRQMPFHVETEHLIFVHAGLDLQLSDWRKTTDYQKVWIRTPFYETQNKTGKGIVFGHTPTYYLTDEHIGSSNIWQSPDGKIGIDGGAVYGGVLHGIRFENGEIIERQFIANHTPSHQMRRRI